MLYVKYFVILNSIYAIFYIVQQYVFHISKKKKDKSVLNNRFPLWQLTPYSLTKCPTARGIKFNINLNCISFLAKQLKIFKSFYAA